MGMLDKSNITDRTPAIIWRFLLARIINLLAGIFVLGLIGTVGFG
jgi:hypothetical protein